MILIKGCKIQYLNLDKANLFPRNQVISLKNGNLWRAVTTIEFNTFLLKFCTRFGLTNAYNRVFGTFLFCLDLKLLINPGICECVETGLFFTLANNDRKK